MYGNYVAKKKPSTKIVDGPLNLSFKKYYLVKVSLQTKLGTPKYGATGSLPE